MAKSQTKNLTQGDPKGVIISFTLPLLLSQLFQQLYNSVDSLIVGNFLGKEALAAVGSTGSLVFLMVSFFAGIATGAGVVISRHFGAQDHELVRKSIHTTVLFGLVAGVVLTAAGLAFSLLPNLVISGAALLVMRLPFGNSWQKTMPI